MADQDQTIHIDADVGRAVSDFDNLSKTLANQTGILEDQLQVMQKFNETGAQQEIIVKGMVDKSHQLTQTYKLLGDQFVVVSRSIQQIKKVSTESVDALNELKKGVGLSAVTRSQKDVEKYTKALFGPIPANAADQHIKEYQAQQERLARVLAGRNFSKVVKGGRQPLLEQLLAGNLSDQNGILGKADLIAKKLIEARDRVTKSSERATALKKKREEAAAEEAANKAQSDQEKAAAKAQAAANKLDAIKAGAELRRRRLGNISNEKVPGQFTPYFNDHVFGNEKHLGDSPSADPFQSTQTTIKKFEDEYKKYLRSFLTPAKAAQFNAPVQNIEQLISAGKISATRALEIEQLVREGKAVDLLNASEKATFNSAKQLVSAEEALGKVARSNTDAIQKQAEAEKKRSELTAHKDLLKKQGQDFTQNLSQQFGQIGSNATSPQLNRIQQNISKINQLIASGQVSVETFEKSLIDIKAGTTGIFNNIESGKAINSLRALQTSIEQTKDSVVKSAYNMILSWTSVLRIFAVQVLHTAIGNIIFGLREAVTAASQFSIKIGEVRTLSQDAQLSTSRWSTELVKLSNAYNLPVLDVTKAAYETLSNQIGQGIEAVNFLDDALKFAITTQTTATDSANTLSTAINAYGLSAGDASRLSDIFFKTIDKGRITGQQLDETLGRTLPLAASLGVTLEEVAGSFVVLTREGVQAHEASTQLNAIFSSLLKPTPALTGLLAEWGETTGQGAIATFGFVGVLQKLQQELEKNGIARLGEIAPNIRAIKGVIGTAGDTSKIKQFAEAVGDVTNSAGSTNRALKLITKTPGQKFEKLQTSITNFFARDVGLKLVDSLLKISEQFGGFDNVVKKAIGTLGSFVSSSVTVGGALLTVASNLGILVPVINLASSALGAFVVAKYAVLPVSRQLVDGLSVLRNAISSYSDSILLGENRMYAAGAAMRSLGAASVALKANIALLAVTAGLFIFNKFRENAAEAADEIKTIGERIQSETDSQNKASLSALSDRLSRELDKYRKNEIEKTKLARQEESKRNIDAAKLFEQPNKALKLKNFSKFAPSFEKLLKPENLEPGKQQEKILDDIVNSQKRLQEVQDSHAKQQFDNAIENLGALQQTELTVRRIGQLQSEGLKLFNIDNIEEARKKFDEIDTLVNGLAQKQRSNRAKGAALGVIFNTPTIDANLSEKVQQQKIALEQKYQTLKQQEYIKLEQIKDVEVKTNEELEKKKTLVDETVKAYGKANEQQGKITGTVGTLNSKINQLTRPILDFELFHGQNANHSVKESAEGFKRSFKDFAQDPSRLNQVDLLNKLDQFRQEFLKYQQSKISKNAPNQNPEVNGQNTRELFNDLRVDIDKLFENKDLLNKNIPELKRSGFDLDNIEVNFENTSAVKENTQAIYSLIEQMGGSKPNKDYNLDIPTKEDDGFDPEKSGFNLGGIPAYANGGVLNGPGTDSKLAWFRPDETIMNANATRQFSSQLTAMNAGFSSQIKSGSGSTTNIGDIHVHAHAGENGKLDVRDVAQQLRREIKRGTISLT